MKYEAQIEKKKRSFLSKLTIVLAAIFISTTIFAGLQKFLSTFGIILALIINLAVAAHMIKKGGKGNWRSIAGWTIVYTIIISAIIVFGVLGYASYMIDSTI